MQPNVAVAAAVGVAAADVDGVIDGEGTTMKDTAANVARDARAGNALALAIVERAYNRCALHDDPAAEWEYDEGFACAASICEHYYGERPAPVW